MKVSIKFIENSLKLYINFKTKYRMKRILLLGDKGTGKTLFLNIFLHKDFDRKAYSTIGIEAAARTV